MEGFIFAKYFQPNSIQIYKIVSDHFEPQSITKEKTKHLIKNSLQYIEELSLL